MQSLTFIFFGSLSSLRKISEIVWEQKNSKTAIFNAVFTPLTEWFRRRGIYFGPLQYLLNSDSHFNIKKLYTSNQQDYRFVGRIFGRARSNGIAWNSGPGKFRCSRLAAFSFGHFSETSDIHLAGPAVHHWKGKSLWSSGFAKYFIGPLHWTLKLPLAQAGH